MRRVEQIDLRAARPSTRAPSLAPMTVPSPKRRRPRACNPAARSSCQSCAEIWGRRGLSFFRRMGTRGGVLLLLLEKGAGGGGRRCRGALVARSLRARAHTHDAQSPQTQAISLYGRERLSEKTREKDHERDEGDSVGKDGASARLLSAQLEAPAQVSQFRKKRPAASFRRARAAKERKLPRF